MDGQVGFNGEFLPNETDCLPEEECTQTRQYQDVHHPYFPESDYQTRIEKRFRDLGENLLRICRCRHVQLHNEVEPPEKPDTEYMCWRIRESDEHVSVRLRKDMERYDG